MITRIKSRRSFTCISNDIITDKRLDWKELGLLVYLLSKPDNWKIHTAQLVKERRLGRDGVKAIVKTLKDCGYMGYIRDSSGKTEWWVSEEPQTENPFKGRKPQTEKPHAENPPVLVNTDSIVNTETTSRKKSSTFRYGQEDMELASGMLSLIRVINPSHKQPNMDSWANTIRLMVERDKKNHQQIADVFQWANADSFWGSNILSPAKLREKFDQLTIRMTRNETSNATPGQTRNDLHRDFYEKVATTGELGSCDFREDANTLRKYVDETNRVNREGAIEGSGRVVNAVGLSEG